MMFCLKERPSPEMQVCVSEEDLKSGVRTLGRHVQQIFAAFPAHCGRRVLARPSLTVDQLDQ